MSTRSRVPPVQVNPSSFMSDPCAQFFIDYENPDVTDDDNSS